MSLVSLTPEKAPKSQSKINAVGLVCSLMVGLPKFALRIDHSQSLLIERRWRVNHESIGFNGLESIRDGRRDGESRGRRRRRPKKMRCDEMRV
jgi:hypothetical protein